MARALTVALLCAFANAVAGCGEKSEPGSGAGLTAIDVQFSGDPEEAKLYEEVAAAYARATGGKVNVTAVADRKDFLGKLTSSFAARRPPDAFLINHRYMGAYAQRAVIEPVQERLGADREKFHQVALDAFTFGGKLQCLPQNVSSLVVYYNVDLFEKAGVERPAGRWTFVEFVAAASRLTRDGVHGVGVEPAVIRAAPFVWSEGGELVDDEVAPTRFTLDTPEARVGLQALIGLADYGPSLKEVASKGLEERFLDGELAMFLSSRREVPSFRTIRDFEWDVAGLPVLKRPATVLHSDGWCLSKGGDTESAWRFVRFATGPEGQRILSGGGRTVPSLKSATASRDFLDPTRPPRSSQVFVDQIRVMRRLPTTASWERIEESANLALEQAFYGRLSLDEAIERIQRETEGRF